ncbi:hypothetical protein AJ80_06702 [Polytolypa hystricis UAMH7299]|uniref:Uncharacterized protein n=1 Tax=Polytolypa hystricis (strain UAMH7299) TaxID=1447883 RepID=A0A2B7XUU3_POLH7|nr:hypothetical protein AJ80_06702 [Polytolypa hystricis UAMH7299]
MVRNTKSRAYEGGGEGGGCGAVLARREKRTIDYGGQHSAKKSPSLCGCAVTVGRSTPTFVFSSRFLQPSDEASTPILFSPSASLRIEGCDTTEPQCWVKKRVAARRLGGSKVHTNDSKQVRLHSRLRWWVRTRAGRDHATHTVQRASGRLGVCCATKKQASKTSLESRRRGGWESRTVAGYRDYARGRAGGGGESLVAVLSASLFHAGKSKVRWGGGKGKTGQLKRAVVKALQAEDGQPDDDCRGITQMQKQDHGAAVQRTIESIRLDKSGEG